MGADIAASVAKAKVSLSTSDRMDETTAVVNYVAPDSHYLESWNDFELISGTYSLSQPTISRIFDTRQAQQSLLTWGGNDTNYYDFIRANWEAVYAVNPGTFGNFDQFWDKSLHDGVLETDVEVDATSFDPTQVDAASSAVKGVKAGSGLELVLYTNSSVGNGRQSNNPWLQEMPDPITKACWDNYLTVSPKQAEDWGIKVDDGRMSTQKVNLTVNGKTLSVPVLPQPGPSSQYHWVGLGLWPGESR